MGTRRLVITLAAALAAALAALGWQWWNAPWPLVYEGDAALVQKALRDSAAEHPRSDGGNARRFPIVIHTATMDCVELRVRSSDPGGSESFCYDRRSGRLVEAREAGPTFP